MTIPEIILSRTTPGFSFEVLPPLKGKGIKSLFRTVEDLKEKGAMYVNITTHRSELVFRSTDCGLYEKVTERSRPGTVAVAAAIQNRYSIPAVPHIICSGFSKTETEYALIDLNFLGITNLLLLRGDKAKHDSRFIPNQNGHSYAVDLQRQVNQFNEGHFVDGTPMEIIPEEKFSYGVAGYPEKHDESPNADLDLMWLKNKVDNGAQYVVTQMFFDNSKYFEFTDRCRKAGIDVPIIPGIKPIINLNQLTLLPKVFKVDIPTDLAKELLSCRTDDERKDAGVTWATAQVKDLISRGAPSIHFYSHNAAHSVNRIVSEVF